MLLLFVASDLLITKLEPNVKDLFNVTDKLSLKRKLNVPKIKLRTRKFSEEHHVKFGTEVDYLRHDRTFESDCC